MFSIRWLLFAVTLTLLFIQLANACAFAKRATDDRAHKGAVVRRSINFPDTNAGKTINKGGRPRNRTCKKWFPIRDEILRDIFNGECGDPARAAVRLAFHDAGTFSLKLQRQGRSNGGADGSLLTDPTEVQRTDNNGLQDIVSKLRPLASKYRVSNADILHVAGILGVIICPGGPVIETWVGRRDRPLLRGSSPTGLLPDVNDSVEKMVDRFRDMGFTIRDLMALIGAHTTATQRSVDPSRAGEPQDTTPDIWDVKFYGETLSDTSPAGVFVFASDHKFARHNMTRNEFERFVDDQDDWDEDYAVAHEKMSLLGQDKRRMTRCTEILPPKIDLGPLFVDKDAGMESDDEGDDQHNEDAENEDFEPDDATSLRVDRERLRRIMRKLRGYWGYDG